MCYNRLVSFFLFFFFSFVILKYGHVVEVDGEYNTFLTRIPLFNILEAKLFGTMFCKEEIIATLNFNVPL